MEIKGNRFIQIDSKLVLLMASNKENARSAIIDNHLPLIAELKKHTWFEDGNNRTTPYFRSINNVYLHKFIYEFFYKSKPKNCLDHLNNCGLDNRILNMHDIPKGLNNKNLSKYNNVPFKLDFGQSLGLYFIIANDEDIKFSIATSNFEDYCKHKKMLYNHGIQGYQALAEQEKQEPFGYNLLDCFKPSDNSELDDVELKIQGIVKQLFQI